MALVHSEKCAVEPAGWAPWRRLSRLINWLQQRRQAVADRYYLASLNDHNLNDLGLSRHDVDRDAMSRDRFW